jgi:hypothetical protein
VISFGIGGIDPVASMQVVDNDLLHKGASAVRDMLPAAVNAA